MIFEGVTEGVCVIIAERACYGTLNPGLHFHRRDYQILGTMGYANPKDIAEIAQNKANPATHVRIIDEGVTTDYTIEELWNKIEESEADEDFEHCDDLSPFDFE